MRNDLDLDRLLLLDLVALLICVGLAVVARLAIWRLTSAPGREAPRPPPASAEAVLRHHGAHAWTALETFIAARRPKNSPEDRAAFVRAFWTHADILWRDPIANQVFAGPEEVMALLAAQQHEESGFNRRAVSPDGWDRGPAQFNTKPFRHRGQWTTMARLCGVNDVFDIDQATRGQATYLKWLLRSLVPRWDARLPRKSIIRLAIAGYNCSGRRVLGGVIPENGRSRPYSARVMKLWDKLKKEMRDS